MDDWEAAERARIVAAAGSGGSAVYRPLSQPGTLKFGESTFGDTTELRDDDGNLLVAQKCHDLDLGSIQMACIGSHLWVNADGVPCYCAGPEA